MADEWLECVCQFFRSQSQNLAGIMNQLSNQNTISDLGGNDLALPPPSQGTFAAATPYHFFMLMLLMVFAWMQLFNRRAKEDEKPVNRFADPDKDKPNDGGDGGGAVH